MSIKSSTDPRVRRSRKWLQDALRNLVQGQTYESITVHEIAARAEVNRTTFYQHFRDKDELLDSILSDLLNKLFAEGDEYLALTQELDPSEAPPFFFHLFDEVGKDADFFRRMLGQQGSPLFVNRMVNAIEAKIFEKVVQPELHCVFRIDESSPPPAMMARFLAVGLVGSLSWWLENLPHYTARQVADWTWAITCNM